MKTPEDEAFDDLAKKQGAWGGGFQAKRQAAMDKINSHFDAEYKKMHEDALNYGTSWEKDGKRIDPMSVYKEPAHERHGYDWSMLDAAQESLREHMARIKKLEEALAQPEPEMLTIAYQSGYHDGKKAALAKREWNFCERCGKRTADKTVIHTCTPPQEGK